jgi:hypothetical protein
MARKPERLSPAQQRAKNAQEVAAKRALASEKKRANPDRDAWAQWEVKVGRLHGRDYARLGDDWLAHVPEIDPPGSPPPVGVEDIASVRDAFKRVDGAGSAVEQLAGARPTVLHEAFFLAHKAIHVQLGCAEATRRGFHTWVIVDAYQSSLFALASVLAFLGLTIARDGNHFVVVDVWAKDESSGKNKNGTERKELYHLIRFKSLDHFTKWAILQRVLQSLTNKSPLASRIEEAIKTQDEKAFAKHRNSVHYETPAWLADDLLAATSDGPVKPAATPAELFGEIANGSPLGCVYLMCALIELACDFASGLKASRVVAAEFDLLNRRADANKVFVAFDWATL